MGGVGGTGGDTGTEIGGVSTSGQRRISWPIHSSRGWEDCLERAQSNLSILKNKFAGIHRNKKRRR